MIEVIKLVVEVEDIDARLVDHVEWNQDEPRHEITFRSALLVCAFVAVEKESRETDDKEISARKGDVEFVRDRFLVLHIKHNWHHPVTSSEHSNGDQNLES